MKHHAVWFVAALLPMLPAIAQVSTATASFSQLTLTGVDLEPGDAYLPLPYSMANFTFSHSAQDPESGASVTLVSQSANLPYVQSTMQGAGSVLEMSSDGAGQFALVATASGSEAKAGGGFTVYDNLLAPIVINPQTRYTLQFDYLFASSPDQSPASTAMAAFLAFMVLQVPGATPIPINPVTFGGNSQGTVQMALTNPYEIPGTLIVRISSFANAEVGVIPEPASMALWVSGLAVLAWRVRRASGSSASR